MYQEMVYQTPSSPPLPTMPSSGLVDPFPYLVKILGLAKAATGILVVAADISPHQRQQLTLLQLVLNDYNMNLPNELRFETAKFQRYVPLSQGGCFVLIHVSREEEEPFKNPTDGGTSSTALVSHVSHGELLWSSCR